jgi:hypothetical protein
MSDADVRAHIEAAQRELDAALLALGAPEDEGTFVAAEDDLAQVLATAAPAATLWLDVAGRWELPYYTFTQAVTLETVGTLPEGRVSPEYLLPTIVGFLTLAPDVTLRGLRVEGPHPDGTLVTCGDRTLLDRCVIVGSAQGQHRGVRVDAADIKIEGCHISNIWKDQDTQAICGWDGCHDLVVRDCYLEASGENVLFGGADASSADRMPHDVLIEDCWLTKRLAWREQPHTTCKNLFELKAVRNVVVRRCTLEYSWLDGQDGFAIVLTPRNNDGSAPWSTVEHVLFEACAISHMGSGVQIMGDDYRFPSGRLTDVEFRGCEFTDIDPMRWGGGGRQIQITRGPQELRILHCTFSGEHLNSCLMFDDPAVPMQGFVMSGSRMPSGEYGIKCPEVAMGTPTLELYAPGYVWENMIIEVTTSYPVAWPPGTTLE